MTIQTHKQESHKLSQFNLLHTWKQYLKKTLLTKQNTVVHGACCAGKKNCNACSTRRSMPKQCVCLSSIASCTHRSPGPDIES